MSVQTAQLAADAPLGVLEPVAHIEGAMPTGITVSHEGRLFICYPKWGDDVAFTVAEVRAGRPVAYPSTPLNQPRDAHDPHALVSVQSVVVDPVDRLWILDTGSPLFQPTQPGGPKLVCVDLTQDRVTQTISSPPTSPCRPATSTTCASTCGGARPGWPSSPTPRIRAPTGSSSSTCARGRAGGGCTTIPPPRPRRRRASSRSSRGGHCWSARPRGRPSRSPWARTGSLSAPTGRACTTAR